LATFTVCIELLAVGVTGYCLYVKWNAVWWVFVAQAFSLAAVCGALVLALHGLRRAYLLDKEHKEWTSQTKARRSMR
jgi:hypothetical protein